MKLNEYFRTNKAEKKNLEISGINNNNIITNSANNTINTIGNRLSTVNNDKNFPLPSLIIKNKKYLLPKGKTYFVNQTGKINKLLINNKQQNTLNGNNNNLSENYKQFSLKGISNL